MLGWAGLGAALLPEKNRGKDQNQTKNSWVRDGVVAYCAVVALVGAKDGVGDGGWSSLMSALRVRNENANLWGWHVIRNLVPIPM